MQGCPVEAGRFFLHKREKVAIYGLLVYWAVLCNSIVDKMNDFANG